MSKKIAQSIMQPLRAADMAVCLAVQGYYDMVENVTNRFLKDTVVTWSLTYIGTNGLLLFYAMSLHASWFTAFVGVCCFVTVASGFSVYQTCYTVDYTLEWKDYKAELQGHEIMPPSLWYITARRFRYVSGRIIRVAYLLMMAMYMTLPVLWGAEGNALFVYMAICVFAFYSLTVFPSENKDRYAFPIEKSKEELSA